MFFYPKVKGVVQTLLNHIKNLNKFDVTKKGVALCYTQRQTIKINKL